MSRLIDAEILAFDIKVKRDYLDTSSVVGRGEYIALNKALVMIDEQPTIDAVEVVRCKDCRFCFDGFCDSEGVTSNALVEPDWFCADGEVKSDE